MTSEELSDELKRTEQSLEYVFEEAKWTRFHTALRSKFTLLI